MATTTDAVPEAVGAPVRRGSLTRLKRAPLLPTLLIVTMILVALCAELLTSYSPTDISLSSRLRPPLWQSGGSWAHPLGTDPMGRDVLTRIIYGARVSLFVVFLSILVGGGFVAGIGLIAG